MTILNRLTLQFKMLFSSKAILISILFIFFFPFLITIFIIPFYNFGSVEAGFSVVIPLLIIMGGVSYNWRISSLVKNDRLNGNSIKNRFLYHSSTFLLIFIIGNFLFAALIILNIILVNLNLLLESYGLINSKLDRLYWERLNWVNAIYAFELTILVTYAFFLLLYSLTNNLKVYYLLVFLILILYIIFGSYMNNFFLGMLERETLNGKNITPRFDKVYDPLFMFWPSLFFPFYGVAQFYETTFISLITHGESYTSSQAYSISNAYAFRIFAENSLKWTITVMQPYFVIIISLFLAEIIHIKKKR